MCDVRVEEDPDHVATEFLQDLLKDKFSEQKTIEETDMDIVPKADKIVKK